MQPFTFLDIIMALAIVAFVVTRFMSHDLPKENKSDTGNQRQKPALKVVKAEKVVEANLDESDPLAVIKKADPSFNKRDFLAGSKAAYKMVYEALNHEDDSLLDELTAPRIYDEFLEERERLSAAGEKKITTVTKITKAEILDTKLHGSAAVIEVKYTVQQSEVITTDPKTDDTGSSQEVTTVWTWARNLRSTDPNWELEAIETVQ